ENLIGFFTNTLVLRAVLRKEMGFRQLLSAVRERTLAAFAHQDLPFEKLVEELQPDRSLSHSPLFQVMFQFNNATSMAMPMPGSSAESGESRRLRMSDLGGEWNTAKFDLNLGMAEAGDRTVGSLEYSSDLFDRVTIERMIENFQVLLKAAALAPERPLACMPL